MKEIIKAVLFVICIIISLPLVIVIALISLWRWNSTYFKVTDLLIGVYQELLWPD